MITATNLKLREEKQAVVRKAVTDNYTGKTPKGFELDLKMSMIEIVGFPGGAVIKNLSTNAGDTRDTGSIPRPERSPGGWHSNPLQYSCQENPMDRGAWWAMVHGVAKSWIWLK